MSGFQIPQYGATNYVPTTAGFSGINDSGAFNNSDMFMGGAGLETGGGGWLDSISSTLKNFSGTEAAPGPGKALFGGLNTAWNIYSGLKQYGQAKKSLAFQKEAFNKQFDMQKGLVGRDIEMQNNRIAKEGRVPVPTSFNPNGSQQTAIAQVPAQNTNPVDYMSGFRKMGAA